MEALVTLPTPCSESLESIESNAITVSRMDYRGSDTFSWRILSGVAGYCLGLYLEAFDFTV
jgi:hypothetical protein